LTLNLGGTARPSRTLTNNSEPSGRPKRSY
jgi:hypothetical protein